MAQSTAEVLLGPGRLHTADEGEAFPTDPSTAVAGTFEDIGYSEDGWNIVADVTYEFFTPAEEADPIATLKTEQEAHIRGVAAQFSLENLKLALGGGTISTAVGPPATKTYVAPASTGFDTFTLLFRTKAPESAPAAVDTRDTQVPKAVSASSVDIPHTKGANPSVVAVDFRILKKTGSDLFTIIETTDGSGAGV